jgi:hypothetical protein
VPLASEDFGPVNQLIHDCIQSLPPANRGLMSVTDALTRNGQLEKVGGASHVTYISGLPHDGGNLKYAVEQVMEASNARRSGEIGRRLLEGTVTAEQAQAELAKPNGRGRAGISIRRPSEILAIPPDERACFLGDRLCGKGKSLGVCGPGGIGKSRLVDQLAAASIIGRDWCGIATHARDTTWLILQSENSNDRLRRDLEALKRWAGKDWRRIDDSVDRRPDARREGRGLFLLFRSDNILVKRRVSTTRFDSCIKVKFLSTSNLQRNTSYVSPRSEHQSEQTGPFRLSSVFPFS